MKVVGSTKRFLFLEKLYRRNLQESQLSWHLHSPSLGFSPPHGSARLAERRGSQSFIQFHVWGLIFGVSGPLRVCLGQGWRELIVFSIDTWQCLALASLRGCPHRIFPLPTNQPLFKVLSLQEVVALSSHFISFISIPFYQSKGSLKLFYLYLSSFYLVESYVSTPIPSSVPGELGTSVGCPGVPRSRPLSRPHTPRPLDDNSGSAVSTFTPQ